MDMIRVECRLQSKGTFLYLFQTPIMRFYCRSWLSAIFSQPPFMWWYIQIISSDVASEHD